MSRVGYYSSSLGWVNQATNSPQGVFEITSDLDMEGYSITSADNGTFNGDVNAVNVFVSGRVDNATGGDLNIGTVDAGDVNISRDGQNVVLGSTSVLKTNNIAPVGASEIQIDGTALSIYSPANNVEVHCGEIIGAPPTNNALFHVEGNGAATVLITGAEDGTGSANLSLQAETREISVTGSISDTNENFTLEASTLNTHAKNDMIFKVGGQYASVPNLDDIAAPLSGIEALKLEGTTGDAILSQKLRFNNDRVQISSGSAARQDGDIAIGQNALTSATAGASSNIVVGNNSTVTTSVTRATVIGDTSTSSGNSSFTASYNAQNSGDSSVLIGNNSLNTQSNAVVLGRESSNNAINSVVIGYSASNTGSPSSTVIGTLANNTGDFSLVAGYNCSNVDDSSIVLGRGASSTKVNTIAVGYGANVTGSQSVAIGRLANTSNISSVAVGLSSSTTGTFCTAVGANAAATGSENATALGEATSASGARSTAVGGAAYATGSDSIAIGYDTLASGANSVVLGYNSEATANNAITIGINTVNSVANSVKIADNAYDADICGSLKYERTNDVWSNSVAPIVDAGNLYYNNTSATLVMTPARVINGIIVNDYSSGSLTVDWPIGSGVKSFIANYSAGTITADSDSQHTHFYTTIVNDSSFTISHNLGATGHAGQNGVPANIPANTTARYLSYISGFGYTTCLISTAPV